MSAIKNSEYSLSLKTVYVEELEKKLALCSDAEIESFLTQHESESTLEEKIITDVTKIGNNKQNLILNIIGKRVRA